MGTADGPPVQERKDRREEEEKSEEPMLDPRLYRRAADDEQPQKDAQDGEKGDRKGEEKPDPEGFFLVLPHKNHHQS